MPRDHAYHQTRATPILTAEQMLARLRTALWVAEALNEDRTRVLEKRELSARREQLNASVDLYVSGVQIDLLSQLWESATGRPWREPEEPELAEEDL